MRHLTSKENPALATKQPNRSAERAGPNRNRILQPQTGNQAMGRLLASTRIQAKRVDGPVWDPLEDEADRAADAVVARPSLNAGSGNGNFNRNERKEAGYLQPRVTRRTLPASTRSDDYATDEALRSLGAGVPLDRGLRDYMEPRFGHDFGNVRLHADTQGERAAAALNARAFTTGNHIVVGRGEYRPQTVGGRKLLAHELSHVIQQNGGGKEIRNTPSRLSAAPAGAIQRLELPDFLSNQFAQDLKASVKEAPQHAAEILVGELWEAIKEHWISFTLVTMGIIGTEVVIGILTAIPEPTLLTKVVAIVLQVLMIAIIGYFAAVELGAVYDEGKNWFSQARAANGDPKKITEASCSFLRMVRHIILAILTLIGVRAKIRGFSVPKGTVPGSAGGGGGGGGQSVTQTAGETSKLRVIKGGGGDGGGSGPTVLGQGSAFEGSAAKQLEVGPQPEPILKVVPRTGEAPTKATAPKAPTKPDLTTGPAAGVATAIKDEKKDKREEEILHRSPNSRESVSRLATKAADAEADARVGIHGVSSFTEPMPWEHSKARRKDVEAHFPVHNTLGPTHRTIQLPKPVTKAVVDIFNKVFGRS